MLKAVILDMDGTITQPTIDWKRLRERIAAPPDKTILDHIASLPEDAAREAEAILIETEREGTENAPLNDGMDELLEAIVQRGIRSAIVTNNHRSAMETVIANHGLCVDVALSRDDGLLKPAPDLILIALDVLDCTASEAIGLGDGRYDLEACTAAGVPFVYLTHGVPTVDHPQRVTTLAEFIDFL